MVTQKVFIAYWDVNNVFIYRDKKLLESSIEFIDITFGKCKVFDSYGYLLDLKVVSKRKKGLFKWVPPFYYDSVQVDDTIFIEPNNLTLKQILINCLELSINYNDIHMAELLELMIERFGYSDSDT